MTQGYEVLERGENSSMLRKKTMGSGGTHFLIALFTIWWTFGLGNLIYALIAKTSADKVLVKYTPPTPTPESET